MGWKIYDDRVEMVRRRFQYFPDLFQWRGRSHRVQSVRRCWTVARQGWGRRIERHYFQVECTEGDFELYQDARDGNWHLRRARLVSAPAPVVRQPLAASR